jgi:hypothetical protein
MSAKRGVVCAFQAAVAVAVLLLPQEEGVVLFAAPFIDPEFARVSAARLQLAVQRFEVIDLEGERPGLTRLVVAPADQPAPNFVPRQDRG